MVTGLFVSSGLPALAPESLPPLHAVASVHLDDGLIAPIALQSRVEMQNAGGILAVDGLEALQLEHELGDHDGLVALAEGGDLGVVLRVRGVRAGDEGEVGAEGEAAGDEHEAAVGVEAGAGEHDGVGAGLLGAVLRACVLLLLGPPLLESLEEVGAEAACLLGGAVELGLGLGGVEAGEIEAGLRGSGFEDEARGGGL